MTWWFDPLYLIMCFVKSTTFLRCINSCKRNSWQHKTHAKQQCCHCSQVLRSNHPGTKMPPNARMIWRCQTLWLCGDLCQKPALKASTLTFFVVGLHFFGGGRICCCLIDPTEIRKKHEAAACWGVLMFANRFLQHISLREWTMGLSDEEGRPSFKHTGHFSLGWLSCTSRSLPNC